MNKATLSKILSPKALATGLRSASTSLASGVRRVLRIKSGDSNAGAGREEPDSIARSARLATPGYSSFESLNSEQPRYSGAALWGKTLRWFNTLSARERYLILGSAVLIAGLGVNQTYTPINNLFIDQAALLAATERNASATPAVIDRYIKLQARREQVERRFKEIEFKEGALSYVENLVRQQPGVAPGFDIREAPPKSFGKSYQQQPFQVRFQTTSSEGFISFLKSVVQGQQSLLLSKLEIKKPRRGDRLEVDLELNTIHKTK